MTLTTQLANALGHSGPKVSDPYFRTALNDTLDSVVQAVHDLAGSEGLGVWSRREDGGAEFTVDLPTEVDISIDDDLLLSGLKTINLTEQTTALAAPSTGANIYNLNGAIRVAKLGLDDQDAPPSGYDVGTIFRDGDSAYYTSSTQDVLLTLTEIGELSDVITGGISDGQVLHWVTANSRFEPTTLSSVTNLDDLSDVTASGAADGDIVAHNGTSWVIPTIISVDESAEMTTFSGSSPSGGALVKLDHEATGNSGDAVVLQCFADTTATGYNSSFTSSIQFGARYHNTNTTDKLANISAGIDASGSPYFYPWGEMSFSVSRDTAGGVDYLCLYLAALSSKAGYVSGGGGALVQVGSTDKGGVLVFESPASFTPNNPTNTNGALIALDTGNGYLALVTHDGSSAQVFECGRNGVFTAPAGFATGSGGFVGDTFGTDTATDVSIERNSSQIVNFTASGADVTGAVTLTGELSGATGLGGIERSSDPSTPAAGKFVIWQSDGTGSGSDGDLMASITDSGGTNKVATIVDFSAV